MGISLSFTIILKSATISPVLEEKAYGSLGLSLKTQTIELRTIVQHTPSNRPISTLHVDTVVALSIMLF